jgi:hypothetical protein
VDDAVTGAGNLVMNVKPLTTETQRHREKTKKRKALSLVFSVPLKETLIKSKSVIPAKAGIHEDQ